MAGAILSGMAEGVGAAGKATALAMKDKAIEAPGSHASSLLGLANAKLDQGRMTAARPSSTAAQQGQRR